MSIFKGPGILLNPLTARQPAYLPRLFDLTIAAKGANLCAVRDELGAIAYALHEDGKLDESNRLFDILTPESEYSLAENRDDILKCIECATSDTLARALIRSGRYFRDFELRPRKPGRRRRVSTIDILEALCNADSQTEAARALDISQRDVSTYIAKASEDSLLGVFKGVFKGKSRKMASDEEIIAALAEYGTLTAAGRALGITASAISKRMMRAEEGSRLAELQGTFKPGGRRRTKGRATGRVRRGSYKR